MVVSGRREIYCLSVPRAGASHFPFNFQGQPLLLNSVAGTTGFETALRCRAEPFRVPGGQADRQSPESRLNHDSEPYSSMEPGMAMSVSTTSRMRSHCLLK
jgi:hypothetical protein